MLTLDPIFLSLTAACRVDVDALLTACAADLGVFAPGRRRARGALTGALASLKTPSGGCAPPGARRLRRELAPLWPHARARRRRLHWPEFPARKEGRPRFDAAAAEEVVARLDVDGQRDCNEVRDDEAQRARRLRRFDFAWHVVTVGAALRGRFVEDGRVRAAGRWFEV